MISYIIESTAEDALVKYNVDFGVTPTPRKLTAIKQNDEVFELGEINTDDNTYQYYDKRNTLIIAIIRYDEFSNSLRLLTERKIVDNYEFVFGPQTVKFKGE